MPQSEPVPEESIEVIETELRELHLSWESLQKTLSILNIGAAEARFAREAQKKGITVTCLDREEPTTQPTGIDFVVADATSMPFPDNSFDLIVTFGGPPAFYIDSSEYLH